MTYHFGDILEKSIVGVVSDSMHARAGVIEDAEDAWWLYFRLDKLADDFVVEVINRRPLNALRHVLFL